MTYFIIWAVLNVLLIGAHLGKHGQPRTIDGKYNFVRQTINAVFEAWLMYMWGAFDGLFGKVAP